MKYSTQELIRQLTNYTLIHNKSPSIPSANKSTEIIAHYTVFIRRFGSWKNALLAAELSIEHIPKPAQLDNCKNCNKQIKIQEYHLKKSKTKNFFCSQRCAAIFNSTGRIKSEKSKEKLRNTMSLKPKKIKKLKFKWTDNVVGPYTRIYLNKCKKTGQVFYWKSKKPISPYIENDYKEYRRQCQFNFPISLFSMWFSDASALITQYGWYAPGNSKIPNLNGISRDHLISINHGWVHNIPAWKIKHPANMQLIPHTINQTKNIKCNISESELDIRITKFEKLFENWSR